MLHVIRFLPSYRNASGLQEHLQLHLRIVILTTRIG